jgi:hypothetical protein
MLAVILEPVWLVVTAHVAPAVAAVGSTPALAVLITSEGLPLNAIWLIASTWNVTVCVAVWAEAALAAPAIRIIVARIVLVFIGRFGCEVVLVTPEQCPPADYRILSPGLRFCHLGHTDAYFLAQ